SPQLSLLDTGPSIGPRAVSVAEIYLGGLDAQWVEVTGVVRFQKQVGGHTKLEVAAPPYRIRTWISDNENHEKLKLEGSVVRVRGVVGTLMTDKRILKGFQLFANSLSDLTVIQPSKDPFATPPILIRDFKTQTVRREETGRVWV